MKKLDETSFKDLNDTLVSSVGGKYFWEIRCSGKKEIVDSALNDYFTTKLYMYEIIKENKTDLSVSELFELLVINMDDSYKQQFSEKLIYHIMNIMTVLQCFAVSWNISDDESLIEIPEIHYNKDGKLDELITHKQTDDTSTFMFIYDVFQNEFLEKTHTKEIVLRPKKKEQ